MKTIAPSARPERFGGRTAGAIAMMRRARLAGRILRPADSRAFSRRACLAGIALGIAGAPVLAGPAAQKASGDDPSYAGEIAQVQDLAKKAGLGQFFSSRSKHFLGLGDAPELFRRTALRICESLGDAFLAYFKSKGMKLGWPARLMTVITLKDDASYRAFINDDPGEQVGGHYDLETNRLVMFDFRPRKANLAADAELVNHITLIHETSHMLCFNTGMLSRLADVPACISEGLATFVELWRPKGKERIGATNNPRLQVLFHAQGDAQPWIPISELFADDDLCENSKTSVLAYTESWLLVHYLLKQPAELARFRDYLAGIPELAAKDRRIDYAQAKLGSLKKLDQELIRHAKRLR
jgi:hypothetical protein